MGSLSFELYYLYLAALQGVTRPSLLPKVKRLIGVRAGKLKRPTVQAFF